MATDTRHVRLILEGLASEDGHVPFATFLQELQHLRAALKAVGGPRRGVGYRVVELSHASPAIVGLESVQTAGHEPTSDTAILDLGRLLSDIEEEDAEPGEHAPAAVTNLIQMTHPVGRRVASAKLDVAGRTFNLGLSFRERGERLLAPEEHYDGAIRGMLEAINIHEGANRFWIYPDIGPSRVSCHFVRELEETALGAVGRFVEVRGVFYRKLVARFPHRAEVKVMEVYPPEEELPTLEELRGAVPGVTGDLSAEEFVRRIRDAEIQA